MKALGKNFIAKQLCQYLHEGRLAVYSDFVSSRLGGADITAQFMQEARHHGMLNHQNRIVTTYVVGQYIKNSLSEAQEKGTAVSVVRNGKAYPAVVADNKDGKYKLAFTKEKPVGADDDADYKESDFGVIADDEKWVCLYKPSLEDIGSK